jgi:hypothetical protein
MAAKIVFLDRVLANYGSETAETRDLLRRSVGSAINRMWPDSKMSQPAQLDPSATSSEAFFNSIQQLSPQNDAQRSLKSQAVQGDHRCWANALVAIRANGKLDIPSDADRSHRLAGDHLHECRPVCTTKRDRHCCAHAVGTVGGGSDLPDSGIGYAVRRCDPDLLRAHA